MCRSGWSGALPILYNFYNYVSSLLLICFSMSYRSHWVFPGVFKILARMCVVWGRWSSSNISKYFPILCCLNIFFSISRYTRKQSNIITWFEELIKFELLEYVFLISIQGSSQTSSLDLMSLYEIMISNCSRSDTCPYKTSFFYLILIDVVACTYRLRCWL